MKTPVKFIRIFVNFIVASTILISSCKKDENDLTSNPVPPSGATLKTTVVGKITDTDNLVVSGVTVKLGSQTTVTDFRGHFLFVDANVPKDRMVLTASKQGFFECIMGKRTQTGGVNYVDMVMQELPTAVNVSAVAGGVLNIPGGARITFPTNAFVDAGGNVYTGTVKVYARHFNPAADGFAAIVPGGDLLGVNTIGEQQSLYTLGMIEALLKDNSGINEIKLAPGITAQLRFPIDPSQASAAQSNIPLWYLNETTGIWNEEGQALKVGNFFEGNVNHFSTWNCDYQGERTDIVGKVVDCQGVPVAGAVVTINGFMNVITNNNGEYSTWVPEGFTISCQVLLNYNSNITFSSNISTIVATLGQLNLVTDLIVPCASRITGVMLNCNGSESVPGIIYASWNDGISFIFTQDGSYEIIAPENSHVNLIGLNLGLSGSVSIISGQSGSLITASDILMCNTNNSEEFSFIANHNGNSYNFSAIFSNYTLEYIYSTSTQTNITLTGNGILLPGPKSFSINLDIHHLSNYYYELGPVYNLISIQIDSLGNFHSGFINAGTTNNSLIVSDYGSPGSFLSAIFEYDNSFSGVGASMSITNGKFKLKRSN